MISSNPLDGMDGIGLNRRRACGLIEHDRSSTKTTPPVVHRPVLIQTASVTLNGDLAVPPGAESIIVFAHGSGSSGHSPRNRAVAGIFQGAGLATLQFDLLTGKEKDQEAMTRHLRFNIPLLAERLGQALGRLKTDPSIPREAIGLIGSSTGAAAALEAAAEDASVRAVVSRGGRPDLSRKNALVKCPVLLIVGGEDTEVLELNRMAARRISRCHLKVVPGATHLFPEPGALQQAAEAARDWFLQYLSQG